MPKISLAHQPRNGVKAREAAASLFKVHPQRLEDAHQLLLDGQRELGVFWNTYGPWWDALDISTIWTQRQKWQQLESTEQASRI